jgi:hypothetical protein
MPGPMLKKMPYPALYKPKRPKQMQTVEAGT